MKPKEIIEKFDEKFYDINCGGFSEHTAECFRLSKIKQFLTSIIISIYKEEMEEIEKMLVNTPDEVVELNKDLPSTLQTQAYHNALGYTQALQDLRQSLQAKVKEWENI